MLLNEILPHSPLHGDDGQIVKRETDVSRVMYPNCRHPFLLAWEIFVPVLNMVYDNDLHGPHYQKFAFSPAIFVPALPSLSPLIIQILFIF